MDVADSLRTDVVGIVILAFFFLAKEIKTKA